MEREVSEVDRKLLLKKDYLDKINYHLTTNPISQAELYPLVRHFFREFLKLDYEFTYEELSSELNKAFIRSKVKEHIDDFLIRLSESEFLEEGELGSKEINLFLSELADIIMNMISEEQAAARGGDSLLYKVLKIGRKDVKTSDVATVSALIDELNFHITSGNLDSAKRLYVDILKIYDSMRKDDKKKVHEAMNEVYERLQNLMKNPKGNAGIIQSNVALGQSNVLPDVSETIKKVNSLSDETLFYINASNIDSAKRLYSETLNHYDSLNHDEKKLLHSKVNDLYVKLQLLSSKSKNQRVDAVIGAVGDKNNVGNIKDAVNKDSINKDAIKKNVTDAIKTSIDSNKSSENSLYDSGTSEPSKSSPSVTFFTAPSLATSSSTPSAPVIERDPKTALSHDRTAITVVGKSFDYSLSQSPDSVQSSSDEDIDVYRRPLMDDAESVNLSSGKNVQLNDTLSSSVSSLSSSSAVSQPEIFGSTDFAAQTFSSIDEKIKDSGPSANILFSVGSGKDSDDINKDVKVSDKKVSEVKTFEKKISDVKVLEKKIPDVKVSEVKVSEKKIPEIKVFEKKTPDVKVSEVKIFDKKVPEIKTSEIGAGIVSRDIPESDSRNVSKSLKLAHIALDKNIPETTKQSLPKKPLIHEANVHARVESKDIMPKIMTEVMPEIKTSKASEKLKVLLKKINDDIVVEKFDKAKTSYKEALMIYRSMTEKEKAECYNQFYSTYKNLDKTLYELSLNDILETHLSETKLSQRTLSKDNKLNQPIAPYSPESLNMTKGTTLPIMLDIDEATTRVYELIEESYFNMDNHNYDLAMLKYFKSLELYRKLPLKNKNRSYPDLYALFRKLSALKKVTA
ncbi:MAG: hypothetical protein ACP5OA_01955 [Candidatus Woesearchaeota archaeon]